FLNRIDEIVMFRPLQKDEIFKIIDLQIDEIKSRLEDRQIDINFIDEAKELVLNRAYSTQYGARPVKRFLQKEVETGIGRLIIKGDVKDKDTITVMVEQGELALMLNS
ncbi:MAG: type VI secretion system ATPase TssH, partial [Alkaliphilus sp.]|nr:type VI secretion system ATPase TssH [Alkaliphilus sp.]